MKYEPLLDALIYSSVGIVMFALFIWLADVITPFSLKKEIIEKQNMAVAIILGAVLVGIAIIIAAAHG